MTPVRWLGVLMVLVQLTTICAAQEAEYRVAGVQVPVTIVANGYVQTVTALDDREVRVRVSATFEPIGAVGTYGEAIGPFRPATPVVPDSFVFPEELAQRLRADLGVWAAATEVLAWVIQHIELDEQLREPQDAISVLGRRRGRCSGLANATAALLLAAGFKARTVSGLLIGDEANVPHRWVECYLPGAGWVATDPTFGLWVMSPRHLAFADAVRHEPQVEIVRSTTTQLSHLPTRYGRPLRPNHGIELICRFSSEMTGVNHVATLNGPGGQIFRSHLVPEGRFTGLLPGRWLLVVEQDGKVVQRQRLLLSSGQTDSYTIYLSPEG